MADIVVPFKCPRGQKIPLNARLTAPGTVLACPKCRAKITITGDDLRSMQRSMDDLLRAFKNLGR